MYRMVTFGQQRFILATPPCRPAMASLSLTLMSESTTPTSPDPMLETVAFKLPNMS